MSNRMNEGTSTASNYIINESNIKSGINKHTQEQNQIRNKNINRAIDNSKDHILKMNDDSIDILNSHDSEIIRSSESIRHNSIIANSISSIHINNNDLNDTNNDTNNNSIIINSENNDESNNNSNSNSNTIHSGMNLLNNSMVSSLQNFYRNSISESNNSNTNNNGNNNGNDSNNIAITIDNLEQNLENNQPTQIGPGITVWFLFRVYAIMKFCWSFIIFAVYFILFIKKGKESCDMNIFYFSIVFSIVQAIQAVSSLLLIIYLPTSITRYTISIRRRVVISEKAWHMTMITFIIEMIMIIVGTILLFNKSSFCAIDYRSAYISYTKFILIFVVIFYSLVCFPIFVLPCFVVFKLLPEYKGISKKTIKKFSDVIYNPSEDEHEETPTCSICMESYKPGVYIKRLPCNHEFHPDCITLWLETNNTCPICRQAF